MTTAGARLFLHAGFATAALLLFAAASSRAETLDQFYEKAKLERTLVFYSGGLAAPHENRAKEFMQKYPGIAVSVTGGFDVPPPEGFQPLASYKIANNYREFITNDKLVADLRKRFEGYTGPPANKGGVR